MATDNQSNQKEAYLAPHIEVIRMENEGVIAASGSTEGYNPTPMGSARTSRPYNGASSSDLEDLINDILTVEK